MGKKAKGKHRLDKFYHLAKEQGFRSRAAFKLIQLNKKYDFLSKTTSLLDLCAAPGGWLQVAHKYMPLSSTIVGVDLVPIKPIRGVVTLTEDITTERCRAALKKVLPPGGLFEVVIRDGAPNVGGAWSAEAYTQAALVLEACRLATDMLVPKGLFITKVFRSQEYHALLYTFHQLFDKVESTKPLASRSTSAEIYVACSGYRAPGRLDKRLLDPAHVFAPTQGGPDEVVKGEDVLQGKDGETKRHRGGYETTSGVLYREADADAAFIEADSPAEALGAYTRLRIAPGSELDEHAATTEEVRAAIEDLKVLGKRDFRALLKWRDAVRRSRASAAKAASGAQGDAAAEKAEKAPRDEEEALFEEMEELQHRAEARARREKKAKAKAKTKARVRAALGAAGAAETGEDVYGADAELFALRRVTGGAKGLSAVADGEAAEEEEEDGEGAGARGGVDASDEEDSDGDNDADGGASGEDEAALEAQLDTLYAAYAARRRVPLPGAASRKSRARLEGPSALDADARAGDDDGADGDWDAKGERLAARLKAEAEKEAAERNPLVLDPSRPRPGLSPADAWFSNPIFAEAEAAATRAAAAPAAVPARAKAVKRPRAVDPQDDDDDEAAIRAASRAAALGWDRARGGGKNAGADDNNGDFQVVPPPVDPGSDSDTGSDSYDRELDETLDEASKAEIRAYGRLFLHRKSREAALEAGYHKWAWGPEDDLPAWFVADEGKHCRVTPPITAAQAAEEREALRALDARPAKKVAEARARKKKRLQARMEAAKRQANSIADQEDVPLASRMRQIERVYAKSARAARAKTGAKSGPKDNKRAAAKAAKGGKGPRLDPRMRKDARQVNSKKKAAIAKKKGKGGKASGGKGRKGK